MIVYAGATLPRDVPHGGKAQQTLGSTSYGCYVLHQPPLLMIFAFVRPPRHTLAIDAMLCAAGVAGIALVLAFVLIYEAWLEKPFQTALSAWL